MRINYYRMNRCGFKEFISFVLRRISAIAFLGLIQSTVTVWSYKNYYFEPQKVSADLWNIFKHGIGA